MNNLHPIFRQALAPFVKPTPKLKGATANYRLGTVITAKVMHFGPNDYRVILDCADWADGIEFKRAEQFGIAFGHAIRFSNMQADDVQWEIDRARKFSLACQ